jgi:hypothetical protein
MKSRVCKDCRGEGLALTRAAPHPGPRCQTHHRAFRKAASLRSHGLAIEAKYGITAAQYEALYVFQGGRCAICQRATGRSKRLAVDHDHKTGEVRGLLCSYCNQMVGQARDDPEMFQRAADYLLNPPFGRMP